MNYSNNAYSVLGGAITSAATAIQLATGTGPRFPTSDFRATLVSYDANGNESAWEIVHCSSRSGDVLTVTRGQEGTTAVAWPSGARIENRITAGSMATLEPAITPGTTAQYLRGDKGWRDFFTDVRAATLTGLSTATNAVVAAADTVLTAIGKLQAQIAAHFGAGGAAHSAATSSVSGFMSGADKAKLDAIAAGATANNTDAQLRDRTTHTGVQAISTVSGLQAALDAKSSNVTPYVNVSVETTATAFSRYRLTAPVNLTLPTSPADGAWVDVVNHSGTKTARVLRNGQNINNLAEDITLDLLWVSVRFVFRTGYGWFIA